MGTNPTMPLALAAALAVILLATPQQALAADCGGSYVECLVTTGAAGSSDQLHEIECYGAYWDCVSRQLRVA